MRKLIIHIATVLLALTGPVTLLSGQAKGAFEVTHISKISSSSDDMAPVIMNDGILFCSNRKSNPFLTRKNLEGVRLYELYFAPFNEEGIPVSSSRFAPGLVKDANIGPVSLSADGNTLYFTRNLSDGSRQ